MDWFWTDDLARLLISEDGICPESISEWITSPIAVSGSGDALSIARGVYIRETTNGSEDQVA